MFRIIQRGPVITHTCVQCGFAAQYEDHANKVCSVCNASQRIRTKGNKTSGPVCFMLDGGDLWRRIYHEEETNIP